MVHRHNATYLYPLLKFMEIMMRYIEGGRAVIHFLITKYIVKPEEICSFCNYG